MQLIFYSLEPSPPEIRPAPATREWMDATPDAFAYRCLPLNIANAHGWDIHSQNAFRARWLDGPGQEALEIEFDGPGARSPLSHFGSGVLTFHVGYLVRTPPGYDLWVGGPANRPKDGIQPLTGLIETDWSPATFTMNWKFTRPGQWIAFEKGEPFCTVFPTPHELMESVRPERHALAAAPHEKRNHDAWSAARGKFLSDLPHEGSLAAQQKWQKTYYLGKDAEGRERQGHRTKLRLAEVVDASSGEPADSVETFRLKPKN